MTKLFSALVVSRSSADFRPKTLFEHRSSSSRQRVNTNFKYISYQNEGIMEILPLRFGITQPSGVQYARLHPVIIFILN